MNNNQHKKSVPLTISVIILIIIALMASILAYVWVTGYTPESTLPNNNTQPTATPATTPTPTVTANTTNPQDTTYTLSIHVNPTTGGTVTTDKTAPYHQGDTVTLTATPADGYTFTAWSTDASGTSNTITITMNSNKLVTAIFTAQNVQPSETTKYALTVNSQYGTTSGSGLYTSGTTAYATVTPLIVLDAFNSENIRYCFNNWSNDASGTTSPSNPITMDNSKTATANWKTQYRIQVLTNPPEGGTPTEKTQWYDAGATVQISTTVNPDCIFAGWTATEGCATFTNASAPQTTMTVNSAGTVQANFFTNQGPKYLVNFQGLNADATGDLVFFEVTGGSYMGATSPISVAGGLILVDQNATVTYTFADTVTSRIEGKQYKLNGTTTGTISTAAIITGNYKTQYQITFEINPENAGTTTPTSTNWYDVGALDISATAYEGYLFDSWTSTNSITINNQTSATINGAGTITANFKPGNIILTSTFDGNIWDENWNEWINPPWYVATDCAHSGNASAKSDAFDPNLGAFTSDAINATGVTSMHISFWYKANTPLGGIINVSYTGLSDPLGLGSPNPDFTEVANSNLSDTDGQWIQANFTITDPNAFTDSFRLRIESFLTYYYDVESSSWLTEEVWVDDVVITAFYA